MARALERLQGRVAGEVAATKAAWPQIANGLPKDTTRVVRAPIQGAAGAASKLVLPALFEEAQYRGVTAAQRALAAITRP